jgi:hypothetical protein
MTQDRKRATAHATFWIINSAAKIQEDLRYHETDDHIFMVLTGTPKGAVKILQEAMVQVFKDSDAFDQHRHFFWLAQIEFHGLEN